MLKIAGMLILFGLDWLYEKAMTLLGMAVILLICATLIVLFN